MIASLSPEPRMDVVVAGGGPASRNRILALLERDPALDVVAECEYGPETLRALEAYAPELLFLEPPPSGDAGLELISRLDPDRVPLLVVVASDATDAAHAFHPLAAGYLLSPFTDERFHSCVETAKRQARERRLVRIAQRMLQALGGPRLHGPDVRRSGAPPPKRGRLSGDVPRFVCKLPGRVVLVDTAEVLCVTADGDYVTLHTRDAGRFLLRETMGHMKEVLEPEGFVRIHRSCLVRLDQVREVKTSRAEPGRCTAVLRDGKQLAVSESGRRRLEAALGVVL